MTYKYKIYYYNDIKGGGNTFPQYPDNYDEVRSSEWPPIKDTRITINDETKNEISGIVIDNIWNNTASVIKLDNQDHIEHSFIENSEYKNKAIYI